MGSLQPQQMLRSLSGQRECSLECEIQAVKLYAKFFWRILTRTKYKFPSFDLILKTKLSSSVTKNGPDQNIPGISEYIILRKLSRYDLGQLNGVTELRLIICFVLSENFISCRLFSNWQFCIKRMGSVVKFSSWKRLMKVIIVISLYLPAKLFNTRIAYNT